MAICVYKYTTTVLLSNKLQLLQTVWLSLNIFGRSVYY